MSCNQITQKGAPCLREGKCVGGYCSQHTDMRINKFTEGYKLKDVIKATDKKHKFVAIFDKDDGSEKRVAFGAYGYDDFTLTGYEDRRDLYQMRHMKDLETHNPLSPGYLSFYILWTNKDMKKSIKEYKKLFNL
jgi:hypothetical protein